MTPIQTLSDLKKKISGILQGTDYNNSVATEVFNWQSLNCPVIHEYLRLSGRIPGVAKTIDDITYLPIEFFKTHKIYSAKEQPEIVFKSSGTTGQIPGLHSVKNTALYKQSILEGFKRVYGEPSQYRFLALTPTPEERPDSSLVYMIKVLMEAAGGYSKRFYLNRMMDLSAELEFLRTKNLELRTSISTSTNAARQRIFLIGLSYALLDFAEQFPQQMGDAIIVETGGMKGRREELTREELHEKLKVGLGVDRIHSEYGMTELLSQAWSTGDGIFHCPPWMRVNVFDINDPLTPEKDGVVGRLHIIDLANVHSCSFLATSDIGRKFKDGSFEVLGRLDNSDLRGCSLMMNS